MRLLFFLFGVLVVYSVFIYFNPTVKGLYGISTKYMSKSNETASWITRFGGMVGVSIMSICMTKL